MIEKLRLFRSLSRTPPARLSFFLAFFLAFCLIVWVCLRLSVCVCRVTSNSSHRFSRSATASTPASTMAALSRTIFSLAATVGVKD